MTHVTSPHHGEAYPQSTTSSITVEVEPLGRRTGKIIQQEVDRVPQTIKVREIPLFFPFCKPISITLTHVCHCVGILVVIKLQTGTLWGLE